ncbi:hypothetical protein ACJ41O_006396 [Fusarium nematophilum]
MAHLKCIIAALAVFGAAGVHSGRRKPSYTADLSEPATTTTGQDSTGAITTTATISATASSVPTCNVEGFARTDNSPFDNIIGENPVLCQQECLDRPDCLTVSFYQIQCYFYRQAPEDLIVPEETTNFYFRARGCEIPFETCNVEAHSNVNKIPIGDMLGETPTLCQQECFDRADCQTFAFYNFWCFFYHENSERVIRPAEGTNVYFFARDCEFNPA